MNVIKDRRPRDRPARRRPARRLRQQPQGRQRPPARHHRRRAPHVFVQIDRLSRPAINEVFATVANNRHAQNHTLDSPTDDKPTSLPDDIQSFMTGTAGRSQAITDVVKAVIIPDVMKVDLSQHGVPAAYLGVETGGATGSKFGGRALHGRRH